MHACIAVQRWHNQRPPPATLQLLPQYESEGGVQHQVHEQRGVESDTLSN
jgi:hypothetical protein